MNTSQLLIPPRLRVGFQTRKDTYTGQLAYVIYYDTKGELKKSGSWESWRDKAIEAREFDNVPTEGFVLNRDVGGVRHSYGHWNPRLEKVRVYDPRNWEFEITIPNLLLILREGICQPGKGLDGKFVYAWSGNGLVLLPVSSVDYQQSAAFTSLQNQGVRVRELVPGHTYQTKKQEHWVYLGKFDYYYGIGAGWRDPKPGDTGVMKRLVFAQLVGDKWQTLYPKDTKAIACVSSAAVADNFAELVELHTRSARGSKIAKLILKAGPARTSTWSHGFVFEREPGVFVTAEAEKRGADGGFTKITTQKAMAVSESGILHVGSASALYAYHPDYREQINYGWGAKTNETRQPASPNPWREPTNDDLFAVLECGAEVPIGPYSLTKE